MKVYCIVWLSFMFQLVVRMYRLRNNDQVFFVVDNELKKIGF